MADSVFMSCIQVKVSHFGIMGISYWFNFTKLKQPRLSMFLATIYNDLTKHQTTVPISLGLVTFFQRTNKIASRLRMKPLWRVVSQTTAFILHLLQNILYNFKFVLFKSKLAQTYFCFLKHSRNEQAPRESGKYINSMWTCTVCIWWSHGLHDILPLWN